MRGKLIEDLLYVRAVVPARRSVPGTLFNGSAVSVSNNGIDTRDCDEINFVVNAGAFEGAAGRVTVDIDIFESNSNIPSGATLISGSASPSDTASTAASFTQITEANDQQLHTGSIKAKNFKRYMWAKTMQEGATSNFSILAILGKCDRDPQANDPVFDLNY